MGNRLSLKLKTVRLVVEREGPRALLRELMARLSPRNRRDQRRKVADAAAFDSSGYDTGAMAFLDGLTIVGGEAGDGNAYDATPSYDFEAALAMLDLELAGTTFIDLGSGKGRMLILAARKPFARIIGVEFAEELQAIARANVDRYADLHGADPRIELYTMDAARFDFPNSPLVLFLFNPFGAATLRKVAEKLHASWRAVPRPIRIIYVNPQQSREWPAAGFRQCAIAPDYKFTVYAPA
jgi:SAM-dependent methyltransferase